MVDISKILGNFNDFSRNEKFNNLIVLRNNSTNIVDKQKYQEICKAIIFEEIDRELLKPLEMFDRN